MSELKTAFTGGKAFIGFLTGGDPSLTKSEDYVVQMAAAGADLIEIGIPFSDPVAEGPVIQEANLRALSAGATTEKIFEMVAGVRKRTQVPIVFLTYLNPVFRYGYDAFFARCAEVGVGGILIPDLPYEEQAEVRLPAEKYGVSVISMIAPTSEERIVKIAEHAKGFLYLVSSMGVTGVRNTLTGDYAHMVETVRKVSPVPVAVGFGIHSPEQARNIAEAADGVIVGSAIVRLIAEHGDAADNAIFSYVQSMKAAIR